MIASPTITSLGITWLRITWHRIAWLRNTSLPSPENSDLKAFFADQTLTEFLGEGLGVRVPSFASRNIPEAFPVADPENQNNFIRLLFPLTPNPSPREFGERLISKQSVEIRIHGARGAS